MTFRKPTKAVDDPLNHHQRTVRANFRSFLCSSIELIEKMPYCTQVPNLSTDLLTKQIVDNMARRNSPHIRSSNVGIMHRVRTTTMVKLSAILLNLQKVSIVLAPRIRCFERYGPYWAASTGRCPKPLASASVA
jgi:hypothetical protein